MASRLKLVSHCFFDKYNDRIQFCSPVSGEVAEIVRGAKRRILEVRILADKSNAYESFPTGDPNAMSREEITEAMLKAGVWPLLRQRPFSTIANPDDSPKMIVVSCTDTHPLAPDNDFIIKGQGEAFQAGLDALNKLTDGAVHLTMATNEIAKAQEFTAAKNVQISGFSGPHPAGNVGVQIHHLDPLNKGEVVWYTYPQEVCQIGRLFLDGKHDASRVVALTGSEVENPGYYKTIQGTNIANMVKGNVNIEKDDVYTDVRYVSGNCLTGDQITEDGFLGFYHSQITVLPEGNQYKFHLTDGWMGGLIPLPPFGLNKFSASPTYPFHKLMSDDKEWRQDTNIYGEPRAFVVTGQYETVFPFDIYPQHLVKACLINDIDRMEKLGIYEVDSEDFALCEFVCTSKIETQRIIREGLAVIKEECT